MASYGNQENGLTDPAVLSAAEYENLEQTLKNLLETPDEYDMTFYPELLEANFGASNNADGEVDRTTYELPTLEQGTQDSLFGDDEEPSAAPLELQPGLPPTSQFLTLPGPAPLSPLQEEYAPSPRTEKAQNKRSENIGKVNPANFYHPLPWVPTSWPQNKESFQYNSFGELLPHLKFTPEQILEYMTEHPGNMSKGYYDGKNSTLALWIQTAPADSSRRYPNPQSDKCRFACCPVQNNSIHKGAFRVALDEWSQSGLPIDPYHCAGYMHLYCAEKFLPFTSICANFNVRPDTRVFAEGRNKMAITRDHSVFAKFVEKFVGIVSKPDFSHFAGLYDYKRTLCHKLVKTHIELEPKVRQRVREERGGNSIDVHLGDLSLYAAGEEAKKKARDARKPPTKEKLRAEKRKAAADNSPDMHDIFGGEASSSSKRARG